MGNFERRPRILPQGSSKVSFRIIQDNAYIQRCLSLAHASLATFGKIDSPQQSITSRFYNSMMYSILLLMAEILHQLIGSLSHYL